METYGDPNTENSILFAKIAKKGLDKRLYASVRWRH